jgi:hypothetical protein
MPSLTSYTLNNFYEKFRTIEITFTKKIAEITKLLSDDVFLKCGNTQFPCIINSSSMAGAQIIINSTASFFDQLRKNNQKVFLRFAFARADKATPLTFFIQSKVEGYTPLPERKNLFFVRISYGQRPPDDLIGIIGTLIQEASSNIVKRKEERIVVTYEVLKALKIKDQRCRVLYQSSTLVSILRDISASGAKIIVQGKGDVFLNKQIFLCIQFEGEKNTCNLTANVKRIEEIKERDDFIALGLEFVESPTLKGFQRIVQQYLKNQVNQASQVSQQHQVHTSDQANKSDQTNQE